MGRMHSNGKGISRRSLPYRSSAPTWCKSNAAKVTEQICKLAKKGHTPSQIGVILRDFHGVPQVKSITGSKILRILKVQGLAAEIPEDLYCLIKKAVSVRKHLERFRQDKVQPVLLFACDVCAVGVTEVPSNPKIKQKSSITNPLRKRPFLHKINADLR